MAYANPGLRPGLSSAVPTGLNIEMVILTQAFSPGGGASNSVRRDADDQANSSGLSLKPALTGFSQMYVWWCL